MDPVTWLDLRLLITRSISSSDTFDLKVFMACWTNLMQSSEFHKERSVAMEQLISGGFLDFKTRAGAIRPEVGGEEWIKNTGSDEEDSDFAKLHAVKRRIRKPSYTKMSSFIYGLAIFDCRSDIKTLICDRRADLLRSKDEADTRKSKRKRAIFQARRDSAQEVRTDGKTTWQ